MEQATAREGYARLPEDLLRDLLEGVPGVVDRVQALLGAAIDRKDDLRDALEQMDLVRTYDTVAASAICAIDGGFAVERTAAVDLVLSVAVGVEGLSDTTTAWEGAQYEWWSQVGEHDPEIERLARGVMVAQELAILHKAPHAQRILDGSHLTPIIQLNAALTTVSDAIGKSSREVWDSLETAGALRYMASDPAVVAMPKYDSSRAITDRLQEHLGEYIPGDDKLVLGLILHAGELTEPQQVPPEPWSKLHFNAKKPEDKPIEDAFEAAIAPLKGRELAFTYFKPDELSPAFRLEVKRESVDLDAICSTIASQMTGPFVREPYPQYLADVMAKSVGLGLTALQTAVQLGLSGINSPELAEMLVRSYRTEGVG